MNYSNFVGTRNLFEGPSIVGGVSTEIITALLLIILATAITSTVDGSTQNTAEHAESSTCTANYFEEEAANVYYKTGRSSNVC